jgi:hypothetical protein
MGVRGNKTINSADTIATQSTSIHAMLKSKRKISVVSNNLRAFAVKKLRANSLKLFAIPPFAKKIIVSPPPPRT